MANTAGGGTASVDGRLILSSKSIPVFSLASEDAILAKLKRT